MAVLWMILSKRCAGYLVQWLVPKSGIVGLFDGGISWLLGAFTRSGGLHLESVCHAPSKRRICIWSVHVRES